MPFDIKDAETLDVQNRNLKAEIFKLETEKHRLMNALNVHKPTCLKQNQIQQQSRNDLNQSYEKQAYDEERPFEHSGYSDVDDLNHSFNRRTQTPGRRSSVTRRK